jgi:hypothetical protein
MEVPASSINGTSKNVTLFSFTKSENRKVEQGPVWKAGTSGKREEREKRYRRVHMIQTLCTRV